MSILSLCRADWELQPGDARDEWLGPALLAGPFRYTFPYTTISVRSVPSVLLVAGKCAGADAGNVSGWGCSVPTVQQKAALRTTTRHDEPGHPPFCRSFHHPGVFFASFCAAGHAGRPADSFLRRHDSFVSHFACVLSLRYGGGGEGPGVPTGAALSCEHPEHMRNSLR